MILVYCIRTSFVYSLDSLLSCFSVTKPKAAIVSSTVVVVGAAMGR